MRSRLHNPNLKVQDYRLLYYVYNVLRGCDYPVDNGVLSTKEE